MKIDIKEWVKNRKEEIAAEVSAMDRKPRLLILQMGDNPASNSYIKGKIGDAGECGIAADLFKANTFDNMAEFVLRVAHTYDGVILQEPSGLTEEQRDYILSHIGPDRDVDGFIDSSEFESCTPKGIMEIINTFYPNVDCHGEVAVVVGRGSLVGAPLVPMLIKKGFTTISCNSKTQNLADIVKMGDIVVSAVGKPNLITRDMVKDGAFVIDAGICFDDNGKLCGDCDKKMYDDTQIAITPVPGGVGLTTRLALMENTIEASRFFQVIEAEECPF
jgi:methylenetetrahydrofolate dehydrogenase (NADP+)/methenyltetrahydrofolate cyclohydrolase